MIYSYYRNRETGEFVPFPELMVKYSNISFPAIEWPDHVYDLIQHDPVEDSSPPLTDEYHIAVLVRYQQKPNSLVWEAVWEIRERYTPEEKVRLEEELKIDKWNNIKQHRNVLLAETDYTQLPDTNIDRLSKVEFQVYRQILRDITNQPDPYNIQWPVKPEYRKSMRQV